MRRRKGRSVTRIQGCVSCAFDGNQGMMLNQFVEETLTGLSDLLERGVKLG